MTKNKSIRSWKKNADGGDIGSLFELYKYYRDGVDSSHIREQADHYFSECHKKLNDPSTKIILDYLQLRDFRRFSELDINFDDKLTVLIGDNGAGKTSIVEGIAKILSWIVAEIKKEGRNGRYIKENDVNSEETRHFAEVSAKLNLGEYTYFTGSLVHTRKGMKNNKDGHVEELRNIGAIYRVVNATQEVNLPLLAFYSVERSQFKRKNTLSSDETNNSQPYSRFDAYKGALDGRAHFSDFINWFIRLDNLASNDDSINIILLDEIKDLEKIVDQVESDSILKILEEKRTEYRAISISTDDKKQFVVQLECVKSAIEGLVTNISNIHVGVDQNSGRDIVKVKNDTRLINIDLLSQGQKITVALAADLARRLVMLNPFLDNPLEGQGIAIIDEIELHLHPRWQQSILLNLQNTFPNIQFIVTTHSPQVLSTVDVSSIRKLEEDDNGEVIISQPSFQTKGVLSSDVLERVMGTEAIPKVEEAEWLGSYLFCITEGRYQELDCQKLLAKLTMHFGKNHPEIQRCESQIRLQKLKEKIKQKKSQKE